MAVEAFRKTFQIEDLKIEKIGSWIISLRPQQITLGSLVLSLDRKCPHLGEITENEGKELSQAFKVVEGLLEVSFKPNKINYLALMMVDHQVHFHVIPRYNDMRTFKEMEFKDKDWPKPPVLSNSINLTHDELTSIKEFMSSAV